MELSEQFQYGPAFKNKPNSQGTLFRPARKGALQSPEGRQPRGYSPERLSAVGDALDLNDDQFEYGGRFKSGLHAQVARTVARSTVPLEHLKGLDHVEVNKDFGNRNTVGRHEPAGNGKYKIGLALGEESTPTVIHEIGHNADVVHGARDKSRFHGQITDFGAEEGFAERYSDTHAKLPGYKRKTAPPDTIRNPAHTWMGGSSERNMSDFNTAFSRERSRDYTISQDQFGSVFSQHREANAREDREALMYKFNGNPNYVIQRRFGPQYGA